VYDENMFANLLTTKLLIGALVVVVVLAGLVAFRIFSQNQSDTATENTTKSLAQTAQPLPASNSLDERVRNLELSLAEIVEILKKGGVSVSSSQNLTSLESKVKTLETSNSDLQSRVRVLESGNRSTSTTTTSSKTPEYLRLDWTNATTGSDWSSVGSSEVSIAGADYSGYSGMRFEVRLHTNNSSGRAYARLFNKDDNVAVAGTEVSTDVTTSTWTYSSSFTVPANRKTYYLQMKSGSGVGAHVTDAQIKVSY
jgi:hypothetical protein